MLIHYTDCQFAEDLESFVNTSGETEMGCTDIFSFCNIYINTFPLVHAWKFRYSAACLAISVEHVFSTKAPPYQALAGIEKKIHNFPVPPHLHAPERASNPSATWASDPRRALQQYCVLCVKESSSLYPLIPTPRKKKLTWRAFQISFTYTAVTLPRPSGRPQKIR